MATASQDLNLMGMKSISRIKNQSLLILGGISVLGAVGAYTLFTRDSLERATKRLGSAVVNGDVSTIWKFISKSDRDFYAIDEQHFAEFWNLIESEIGNIEVYEVVNANQNAIEIGFGNKEKTRGAMVMVSGNEGEYYSPHFVSSVISMVASLSLKPQERKSQSAFFQGQADWLEKNKSKLNGCGIFVLRSGPSNGVSIDDAIKNYRNLKFPN
jgi:hypothetical protein